MRKNENKIKHKTIKLPFPFKKFEDYKKMAKVRDESCLALDEIKKDFLVCGEKF